MLRAAVAPHIVRSVATATHNQNNTNAIQRDSPVSLQLHQMQTSRGCLNFVSELQLCSQSAARRSLAQPDPYTARGRGVRVWLRKTKCDECQCFVSSNFDLWFILKPRPDILVFTYLRLCLCTLHSGLVYWLSKAQYTAATFQFVQQICSYPRMIQSQPHAQGIDFTGVYENHLQVSIYL